MKELNIYAYYLKTVIFSSYPVAVGLHAQLWIVAAPGDHFSSSSAIAVPLFVDVDFCITR